MFSKDIKIRKGQPKIISKPNFYQNGSYINEIKKIVYPFIINENNYIILDDNEEYCTLSRIKNPEKLLVMSKDELRNFLSLLEVVVSHRVLFRKNGYEMAVRPVFIEEKINKSIVIDNHLTFSIFDFFYANIEHEYSQRNWYEATEKLKVYYRASCSIIDGKLNPTMFVISHIDGMEQMEDKLKKHTLVNQIDEVIEIIENSDIEDAWMLYSALMMDCEDIMNKGQFLFLYNIVISGEFK